jgi:hypothetical protein
MFTNFVFNDTLGSSGTITSNGRMIGKKKELERT